MGLTLVTPATNPVSIADAKAWCRTGENPHDGAVLQAMLDAATGAVEEFLGRSLGGQTWRLELDGFVDTIELPRGPVTALDAFTYVDAAGDEQALAPETYFLDLVSDPARIVLAPDMAWPELGDGLALVQITFTAGYPALPAPLKAEILSLTAKAYDTRVAPTLDAEALRRLSPWRRILI